MTKDADITTIRIPKSVKDDLKDIALTKEPYHATIQRLIRENKSLKVDKDCLMKIVMKTEDSIAFPNINHSIIFALIQVLKDDESSDDEKLNALKIYLRPCLDENVDAVLSNIKIFKEEHGSQSPILDELIYWINKTYCLNSI